MMSQPSRMILLCAFLLALNAACSRIPPAGSPPATVAPVLGAFVETHSAVQPPSSPPASTSPAPTVSPELPAPETFVIPSTPSPAGTPAVPQPRRLTDSGCCVQPFWSPDSRRVLFLDRPDPNSVTGIWSVSIDGGAPELITDRLGIYSPDLQLRAFLEGGQTLIERFADGRRWTIPNGGRSVSFSPGAAWVAWTVGPALGSGPQDTARREIWISRPDGSQARQVGAVTGGGFSGWVTDARFLISGRPDDAPELQALWIADLPAEEASAQPAVLTELARAARLRSAVVSPGGGWVVYLVTFSDDPTQDGLWLASTAGGRPRKLEWFGAYRWRDENRLLVIPLEPGAASNRLIQVDAAAGRGDSLTDPAATVFKIAGGDWSVSPDGRNIVYLSAQDQNLWLLELP